VAKSGEEGLDTPETSVHIIFLDMDPRWTASPSRDLRPTV